MRHQPIHNFSELTVILDRSGIIQEIAGPDSVFGQPVRALRTLAFFNLIDEDQARSFEECFQRIALQPGSSSFTNFAIVRPDGSRAELEGILRHAGIDSVQLDARDITERRRSSVLRDRAIEAATSAFCISDATLPDMPLIYVNPAFERFSGYSSAEILGRNCRFLQGNDTNQPAVAELRDAIRAGKSCRVVIRNYKKNGELFWNDLTVSPIFDQAGHLTHFVGVQSEITQEHLLETRLSHSAFHDGLTDLPNRFLFLERMEKAIACAVSEPHTTCAVFLVDLNRFCEVNDRLGHQLADRVLVHTAASLQNAVGEGDTVARLAGNQFAVLASAVNGLEHADLIGERILAAVRQPCLLDGQDIRITASIGAALASESRGRLEEILRNAESALARGKRLGTDNCVLYQRGWRAEEETKLELEAGIRRALTNAEFTVHYQPIVNIASGRTLMFEALVRWMQPMGALLAPGAFMPAAEELGLILPLGRFVLCEVCRQITRWRKLGGCPTAFSIAVNLSGQEFAQAGIVEFISATLAEFDIPAQYLRIELTETILMDSPESARAKLHALRDLGIRVKIDDFGTGHSSLARLQNLSFDSLKIDKSFIDHIEHDRTSAEIVRSITAMAHTLGLQVVAEGVETAGQARLLREFGCEYAQGYFYARPMPAEKALAMLLPAPERAAA